MAIPTLESMDARLDANCTDILGDSVRYAADGATYADIAMHVIYADGQIGIGDVHAIAQDITVSVMKTRVPEKPSGSARLQFPKLPDQTFKPVNISNDDSGTHWLFQVKDVPHV